MRLVRARLPEEAVANLLCQQQKRVFCGGDHRPKRLRRVRKLRGNVPRLRHYGGEIRRYFR